MLSSSTASALWKAQDVLHGKSRAALPGLMLAVAGSLVIYRHATEEEPSEDPLRTFLALIVVQMLPLVFLEIKFLDCPDPAGLLSKFGAKVLLMHACFLALRICAHPFHEVGTGLCNVVGLVGAFAALHKGFGFRLSSVQEHRDVWLLVAMATAAAAVTSLIDMDATGQPFLVLTILDTSNYIEMLAFVPAVWMVHKADKKGDAYMQAGGPSPQEQAVSFFAFLVGLYIVEDVVSALKVGIMEQLPIAAAGHIAHFLLVLDVACFLVAHFCNPEKLKGQFMSWFSEACSV